MANEQYGFYVDTTRCIKCWGCTVACKQWHGIKAGTVSRRNVDETTEGVFPNVNRTFTSLSCMHCELPLCKTSCPEGAISKRDEDGIVVIDLELCIGCGACVTNCPFDVPQLLDIEEDGKVRTVADKCDACLSLNRQAGEDTRCVITCPLNALHFGTLTELEALAQEKDGVRLGGMTRPAVFVS